MNILLSAYSCSPHSGSEPGGAWNWACELARAGHDVTVLTLPLAAEIIARELQCNPLPGLKFNYVPTPRPGARVPGQPGVYAEYLAWQWVAYRRAKRLITEQPFDLVHHISFGSLVLGSFMGLLPVPFVFGPVGGGQTAPRSLRRFYPAKWHSELIRTAIVRGLLPALPTARLAVRKAALVLVANEETHRLVSRLGTSNAQPMPDMGVSDGDILESPPEPGTSDELRLLWVGRIMPWKGLPLALHAMAALPRDLPVRLRIVGYGLLEHRVHGWIEELGISDRVEYVGRVAWEGMDAEYRNSDALLFTSLRDSGGIQMLEAMARGCPIIALDHQGARVIVSPGSGIRVPVKDAQATVRGLASAITSMLEKPDERNRMAVRSWELAHEHTWRGKVETVTAMYADLAGDGTR